MPSRRIFTLHLYTFCTCVDKCCISASAGPGPGVMAGLKLCLDSLRSMSTSTSTEHQCVLYTSVFWRACLQAVCKCRSCCQTPGHDEPGRARRVGLFTRGARKDPREHGLWRRPVSRRFRRRGRAPRHYWRPPSNATERARSAWHGQFSVPDGQPAASADLRDPPLCARHQEWTALSR